MTVQGQCLCGAVQITVTDAPGWVGVCHCDMCKRWSGAVFASFPASDFQVTGPVVEHASSKASFRAFCGTCGSSLWYKFLPTGNRTSDADISRLADSEERIVVTKDSDFRDSHLLVALQPDS